MLRHDKLEDVYTFAGAFGFGPFVPGFGAGSFFPVCVVAEEPVRITNGEWLPFFSESLKDFGLPSKLVSEAFALEKEKAQQTSYQSL